MICVNHLPRGGGGGESCMGIFQGGGGYVGAFGSFSNFLKCTISLSFIYC